MSAASIGEIDKITYEGNISGGNVKIIDYYENVRLLYILAIPVCFWWLSAISMFGEYIVAGAASSWFFAKEKDKINAPIRTALRGA